jgi:hypothetical protein
MHMVRGVFRQVDNSAKGERSRAMEAGHGCFGLNEAVDVIIAQRSRVSAKSPASVPAAGFATPFRGKQSGKIYGLSIAVDYLSNGK